MRPQTRMAKSVIEEMLSWALRLRSGGMRPEASERACIQSGSRLQLNRRSGRAEVSVNEAMALAANAARSTIASSAPRATFSVWDRTHLERSRVVNTGQERVCLGRVSSFAVL